MKVSETKLLKLSLAQRLVLLPIRFYRRYLTYLKGFSSCRFHPTCSAYAEEAVRLHGVLPGIYLAIKRVIKCHPFNPGGFDPVPLSQAREFHDQPKQNDKPRTSEEF